MKAALAAGRAYLNPAGDAGTFTAYGDRYDLLWSYYQNSAFERVGSYDAWSTYRGTYRLYPFIRSLYNPTTRIVDFQSGAIYPGVLTTDPDSVPEGVPIAIPLGADTSEELREALAVLYQWSNWSVGMSTMTTYGGALGDAFVRANDERDRGKITWSVMWPGVVTDLRLDGQGNVKRYALEYDAAGDDGKTYRYKETDDGERIAWFRDGTPWDRYGEGTEVDNPYGFVPAVWVKHTDLGGDHGAPAIGTSIGKVDALNSLASQIHRQIGRVIESPQVIATDGTVTNAIDTATRMTLAEAEKSITLFKVKAGSSVHSLAGNLDLGTALPYLESLMSEIEADHPELSTFSALRGMSSLTGPAVSRLLGDVQTIVSRAAANYDNATRKLVQMSLAIGGMRANAGDWGRTLTKAQAAFRPFDLRSYERGLLDFRIESRPLVPPLKTEGYAAEMARAQALGAYVTAGVEVEVAMRFLGFTDEEIAKISIDRVAAIERARTLAMEDRIPTEAQ